MSKPESTRRPPYEPGVRGSDESELSDISEGEGLSLGDLTTASEPPSCTHCGRPLTGRKERFCSDRCRMRFRRTIEEKRRRDLIDQLREVVTEVEIELLGEVRR